MKIKQQLVSPRDRTYPGTNTCEFITVHETGNTSRGANAQAHADLQSTGNVRNASWHIQVDDIEAIRSFLDSAQCWHAGDGRGPGNLTSLALEICVNADGDYKKAKSNAIEVIRMWRTKHNIPREKVVQHHHWNGKNCPTLLRSAGTAAWKTFVAATDPGVSMATFVSPAQGRVTSEWGPRERHPVTGVRGFHRGIDIAPPKPGQRGIPVYACYGGTVRATSTAANRNGNPITGTWNSGSYVLIDGPSGGSEWYGHLATIDVRPGQKVQAGDRLGTMGDVGNVTGIHLHLEMWNGRSSGGGSGAGNTRNPRVDFKKHGVVPGSAPVLSKNPTAPFPDNDKKDWLDMVSEAEFNSRIGKLANDLHLAMRDEVNRVRDELKQQIVFEAGNVHAAVLRDLPQAVANAVWTFTTNSEPRSGWTLSRRAADAAQESAALAPLIRQELNAIAKKVGAPTLSAAEVAEQVTPALVNEVRQYLESVELEHPTASPQETADQVARLFAARLASDEEN